MEAVGRGGKSSNVPRRNLGEGGVACFVGTDGLPPPSLLPLCL